MKIFKKLPVGVKESDIKETDFYTWFLDLENKTFSLTKVSEHILYITAEHLLSKGFTYER